MLPALNKFLTVLFKKKKILPAKERYGLDNLDDEVIGYPPNPAGIPVVKDDVIFGRLNKQVKEMRQELGLTESQFDRYLLPILKNLAKFVHLLPASEYHHHCTGGGLVYHSFDVALRSIRHSSMAQYPALVGGISDTQQAIQEWKTATVIASLLHDVGKAITDVIVHNGQTDGSKKVWNPDGSSSLTEWAYQEKIERYYLTWVPERQKANHKNSSASLAGKMIPQQTLEWIGNCYDGKAIRATMFDAIAGESYDHVLSRIVAECDAESIKRDFYNRNSHMTKDVKRTPLSLMLVDLIRFFIMKGKWAINKKNATVWYVNNELYIIWSLVVPELIEELEKAGFNVPESPDILARTMIEEQEAVADGSNLYFNIYPEILRDAKNPKKLTVLKILHIDKIILQHDKLYSIGEHSDDKNIKVKIDSKPEEIKEKPEEIDHEIKEVTNKDDVSTPEELELSEAEKTAEPEEADFYLEPAKTTVKRLIGLHKKGVSKKQNEQTRSEEFYDDIENTGHQNNSSYDEYFEHDNDVLYEMNNTTSAASKDTGDARRDVRRKELSREDEPEKPTKTIHYFDSYGANYIVNNIPQTEFNIKNGTIFMSNAQMDSVIFSMSKSENMKLKDAAKILNDSDEVKLI